MDDKEKLDYDNPDAVNRRETDFTYAVGIGAALALTSVGVALWLLRDFFKNLFR